MFSSVMRKSRVCLCILLLLMLLTACSGPASPGSQYGGAGTEALPEEPQISGETYPVALSNGQFFGLRGTIVCRYPMTRITGTVTNRVTGETIFDISVAPHSTSYAIGNPTSETINDRLEFNSPRCSNSYLNYALTVEYEKDGQTLSKVVLDKNFKVGSPEGEDPDGMS